VSFHFGPNKQKTRNSLDCPVTKSGQRPAGWGRLDRVGKQIAQRRNQENRLLMAWIAILDVGRMDYDTN